MKRLEVINNFCTNIEKERLSLGMTQQQFAKSIGLSLSSYKRIITGETSKIDLYTFYLIYQRTGKLPLQLIGCSDPLLDLLHKAMTLSENGLNTLNAIIDFQKGIAPSYLPQSDSEDRLMVFVPTSDMRDGMIYDSSNYEWIDAGPYRKRYGLSLHCGVKITSNHLHPVYLKNDILLVSCNPIRDGDTGIFINKESGRCYLRKFHQTSPCTLEPINGYGETFYVDSNNPEDMEKWIKFGYILAKMR